MLGEPPLFHMAVRVFIDIDMERKGGGVSRIPWSVSANRADVA